MLGLILLLEALTLVVSGPPTSPEYLPLHVAEAAGDFRAEGLDVVLRTARSEVGAAEALAQGRADLAATSLEAILRFGPRQPTEAPRLVFGLTAAPPVALLVARERAAAIRGVGDLAGLTVGLTAPGAPEHTWLLGLLARAGLDANKVRLVSTGGHGLAHALREGEVAAGLVAEPEATRLITDRRATLLADLRDPRAVATALGAPTVNAAVFARADRRPANDALAAFARALLAATRRLATDPPASLAGRLPAPVVGVPEEFEARLDTTRGILLHQGMVSPAEIEQTIRLIRAHLPLPGALQIPRAPELLDTEPLRRAVTQRPPG